jgi:primosomal protein N''
MMDSKYAPILNALDEMQQIAAYAVRRGDLAKAECLIVALEQENAQLKAEQWAARAAQCRDTLAKLEERVK